MGQFTVNDVVSLKPEYVRVFAAHYGVHAGGTYTVTSTVGVLGRWIVFLNDNNIEKKAHESLFARAELGFA